MHITIKNYTKEIKRINVLNNINLDFESGKIYGLKGVNGSGKTMLMRAICGLILPTAGSVCIDGREIGRDIAFPPSVGLLLENPAFVNGYTGYRNLKMISALKGTANDEDIKNALKAVGLNPEDKRTFKKYSLGMKQKLGIACAFMENQELIILDEPTNALDEKGVKLVKELIMEYKEKGALIIISCHEKEHLEALSDEIIEMYEGRII